MPKITGGITAAIVAVLLLTGCAGTAEPAATGTAGIGTEKAGPTATDAPLVAETPAATTDPDDREALFLAQVREELPANTQIPNATDQQLLDAGNLACEKRAEGADPSTLSVIEGERDNGYGAYLDSGAIVSAAGRYLCD